MPSLHSQFTLLVPMYPTKPSFLGPRIKSGSPGFLIVYKLAKTHSELHALGSVLWSQVVLAFAVTARQRPTSSSFKLTGSEVSSGVNYKLYGLLHFINLTLGSWMTLNTLDLLHWP